MNLQAYNFYFPSFQTSTSTFRWVTGYLKKRIFQNCIKNGLSLGPFFLEIFYRTPPIFLQNLKALEMSFSKLVLHVQKVKILRDLCFIKVCLWKTKIWLFPLRENSQIFVFNGQTLIGHKPLKIQTFWACKTSFEKPISYFMFHICQCK